MRYVLARLRVQSVTRLNGNIVLQHQSWQVCKNDRVHFLVGYDQVAVEIERELHPSLWHGSLDEFS